MTEDEHSRVAPSWRDSPSLDSLPSTPQKPLAGLPNYTAAARCDRLIPLREVEHLTSLKKSTLYAMMKVNLFPAGVLVSGRRRAWLASEIQAFIGSRARDRSNSLTVAQQ